MAAASGDQSFWNLRGESLTRYVLDLVTGSKKATVRPSEATDDRPQAIRMMRGEAVGTLGPGERVFGDSPMYDPAKADPSHEFLVHDTAEAHFLGVGVRPVVRARRRLRRLAEAIEELCEYRDRITRKHETLRQVFMDLRTRGTAAVRIVRNDRLALAETKYIPVPDLVMDPSATGELKATKWRGCWLSMPRYRLRVLLRENGKDPDLADFAGNVTVDTDALRRMSRDQYLVRDQEPVRILDWYWDDGAGMRRHVVIAEGVPEPIKDEFGWPVKLAPGYWPIVVAVWNKVDELVWGASDFAVTGQWQEALAWMLRFIVVASAQAAKAIPVYDKSIDEDGRLNAVLGEMRRSWDAVGLNLRDLIGAGFRLRDLLDIITLQSNLSALVSAERTAREYYAEVSLLREMAQAEMTPERTGARLARRRQIWSEFLAEIYAVEAQIDLATKPADALVSIRQTGDDGKEQVVIAYMPLERALIAERNSVPRALAAGRSVEQLTAEEKRELEVRRRAEARRREGEPVPIEDMAHIVILDQGIGAVVSRNELVAEWRRWFGTLRPERILQELEFAAEILHVGKFDEARMSRLTNLLGALASFYERWGLNQQVQEWATQAQEAISKGQPVPNPPKMLANLLALHRDILRAAGLDYAGELDLSAEDIARALASQAQMLQQAMQAQAAAGAGQPSGMTQEELELRRQELQLRQQELALRLEIERMKQTAEIARQQAEIAEEQRRAVEQWAKAWNEWLKVPTAAQQQMARAEAARARAVQSQAKAAREVFKAEAEAAKAEQQKQKAQEGGGKGK